MTQEDESSWNKEVIVSLNKFEDQLWIRKIIFVIWTAFYKLSNLDVKVWIFDVVPGSIQSYKKKRS